jgi:hypothetical protein
MLNRSLRFDRLNAGLPRTSRAGILSCTRGFRSYRLTRWPALASAQKSAFDGAAWEPDARAANQVFAAYRVPKLRYGLRDGLLCEMDTGQGVMLGLFSDATDEVEQQAFCRVDEQWREFEKAIPNKIGAVAMRFRRNPIAILRLLAVVPEAAVLAQENPAVFFELACHFDAPSSRPELRDDMLRLLRGPQRDILALRGLAATESARRLFRKLPPEDVCTRRLRTLGRALSYQPLARWLRHFAPLDRHAADLLEDETLWPYMSGQLLADLHRIAEVGEDEELSDLAGCWVSWLMPESLGRLRWFHRQVRRGGAKARVFRSVAEIKGLPGLPLWLHGLDAPDVLLPFPSPPVAGTPDVVPITSAEALVEEAARMRNCCGDEAFIRMVGRRSAFFYRVLVPERCTAMVEHLRFEGKDYGWRITELRAYDNAIPRRATLQAVTDALGVPAAPSWHPDGAWWMEHRGLACVPGLQELPATRSNRLD